LTKIKQSGTQNSWQGITMHYYFLSSIKTQGEDISDRQGLGIGKHAPQGWEVGNMHVWGVGG